MKSILSLCVGLLCSFSVFSQTDAYTEVATQCLKNNGTFAFYETIYESCFKQMQDQYSQLNIPLKTWSELKLNKADAMKYVNAKLVKAYFDLFSLEDLHAMNNLYSSHAGQTMLKNPEALTKSEKKEINKFYKSQIGKNIVLTQLYMQEKMQTISDLWCGDMYKFVNEKLEAKGYTIR